MKKWIFRIFILLTFVIIIIAAYVFVQKEEIKQKAIIGINQKLDAEIKVNGKIDITFFSTFPNITLELNKIFIKDKYNEKDTLANVETINFTINPFSLIGDELSIKSIILKNGIVRLKTFKDGKSNYDIVKKVETEDNNSATINLEEIIIEKVDLIYNNLKDKIYVNTFLENATFSGMFYNKNFDIIVDIEAKAEKLSIANTIFLNKNKVKANFDLYFKSENNCISFKENNLNIEGANFNFIGDFCTSTNTINLSAKAKGSSLKNALNLIPKNLFQLEGISGNGKYNIDVLLIGKLNKPKININFNLENANAEIEKLGINFTNINTSGSFSNIPKNNLVIKEFTLKSDKTFLKGNMKIPDLTAKKMELNLDGEIHMYILEKLNIESLSINSGIAKLKDIYFNFNYRKQDSIWVATKLNGEIKLDNLNGKFNSLNQDFKLNSDVIFSHRKAKVKQFNLLIGKNDVKFSGVIKNFLNYFQNDIFGTNDALVLNGDIASKYLNLNSLLIGNSTQEKSTQQKKTNLLKWLNIVSNINLKIDKLVYKKLEINELKSKIKSREAGLFSFKKMKAKSLDGNSSGNIELRFFNNRNLEVYIDTKLKNIDINKLFLDLDNFNQTAITSKNIKGKLDANLVTSMIFEGFTKFNSKELILQTDFVLKDGELIKLKSLKSLSKYLSVEQLEHIFFSTYKSSVNIVNEVISLQNSEIKSNILSLNVGGTHTFENEIDYSLKLNLKNLIATKFKKKKTLDKHYVNDVKGGINIFISMKGTTDDPIIKIDRGSAGFTIKDDLKKEREELKDIFKKDKTYFEDQDEFYFEEDSTEFIDFDN